jgi:hypothetical protein
MLSIYDPLAQIEIHTDGSLDLHHTTPLIDKLTLSPLQLRCQYGKGQSGIYLKGRLTNGNVGAIAIQLTYKPNEKIYTTPFLQELIGIVVGNRLFSGKQHKCHAYTDCTSALSRVQDVI